MQEATFKQGDIVQHHKYGYGVVETIYPKGEFAFEYESVLFRSGDKLIVAARELKKVDE